MIPFVVAGLVLGGIYAIAAAGLVLTYSSSGILNFAFGAEAYFVARMYYFLHTEHGWGIMPAGVVCIVVVAPLLGLFLWGVLFRYLRLSSTLIKVVATIGLSVAIPPLAVLAFGNAQITSVPGLAPTPVKVFHILGTAVTIDQLIVLACVAILGIGGALIIKYTDAGLTVRALVDSEALTSLSGTNPTVSSISVWVFSTLLAGLAGVLVAPIIGLSSDNFTLLVASAFAAVIVARLRLVGRAVIAGLMLGVLGGVVERFVPAGSSWASASTNSIPFAVVLVALLYYVSRGQAKESGGVGGFLDQAIVVASTDSSPSSSMAEPGVMNEQIRLSRRARMGGAVAVMVVVGLLPLVLGGIWVGLVGEGFAFGVAFLSYTLVAGEGSMIWLCQITFAGVGAVVTAELATNHHWPVLLAVVAGGVVAVPIGILIGVLTIRLGDLYIALVTLTFGVLMDNLVFSLNTFYQFGEGITVNRPSFAESDRVLAYLMLGIFCVVSILIVNLRRSSAGLALTAVRWSEPGARTVGVSVLQMKILVTGVATFVAGLGGGLIAIFAGATITTNYGTLLGLVWLAILVTVGVRSNVAAVIAGLAFSLIPALFANYLPPSLLVLPTALFGLGAILVAKNPDGTVAATARQLEALILKVMAGWPRRPRPSSGSAPPRCEIALSSEVATVGTMTKHGTDRVES